jgi:hypothetical protein
MPETREVSASLRAVAAGGVSTRSFERIATHLPMQTVIFAFLEFEFPWKNFLLLRLVSTKLSEFLTNFEKLLRA